MKYISRIVVNATENQDLMALMRAEELNKYPSCGLDDPSVALVVREATIVTSGEAVLIINGGRIALGAGTHVLNMEIRSLAAGSAADLDIMYSYGDKKDFTSNAVVNDITKEDNVFTGKNKFTSQSTLFDLIVENYFQTAGVVATMYVRTPEVEAQQKLIVKGVDVTDAVLALATKAQS